MKRIWLLMISSVYLLSGCAGISMKLASNQEITAPQPDTAKVVFMRYSFVLGGIGVELFDTTGGNIKPIGSLSKGTKVVYETTPGDKAFMAYGNAADFMLAKLEAGKTYYVIARPNWGTGGFAPTPVRKTETKFNMTTDQFKTWVETTEIMEPAIDMDKWFVEKQQMYQEIYDTYWKRFQTKNEEQKQQRTLMPEDGV